MSIRLMTAVWELEIPTTEKMVLLALADNANDQLYCWPSIATLMRKSSLSERAVQGAIAKLRDGGWLEIQERVGRSNYYKLTPALGAPPHVVHPTPAPDAPPPPHHVHPTPARGAPITIIEPSIEPSLNPGGVKFHKDKLPTDWRQQLESVYPKRAGVAGFAGVKLMLKLRSALIEHDWSQIIEGAQRYAEFCEKDGKTGTTFVKAIGNWIEERGYLEAYDYRPPLSAAEREREQIAERDRARMAAAVEAGKRLRTPLHPLPGESAGAFETRVKLAADGLGARGNAGLDSNALRRRFDSDGRYESLESTVSGVESRSDSTSRSHDELRRRIGRTAVKLKA